MPIPIIGAVPIIRRYGSVGPDTWHPPARRFSPFRRSSAIEPGATTDALRETRLICPRHAETRQASSWPALASNARSVHRGPIKDNPTAQPFTVAIGIATCGSPARLAIASRQSARVRSSSALGDPFRGATNETVGIHRIAPFSMLSSTFVIRRRSIMAASAASALIVDAH